ncbi:MAG: shikimate dehydrogenase [Candidatus Firestonebacteria bacterium RIFOXYA2_FULL_40_8]|nr:MAG: shikimate dehydrogenase [Candidatus Firestonebacteria bacterium RIFOXYA2_FULL_40_8]
MLKNKIKLTGVLGYPIKHSLSPAMHNAAFKHSKLNYAYLPFKVKPEECAGLIKLLPELGFTGVNITVPHKQTAYRTVDFLTKDARLSGAVNTIKVKNNKLYGTSTDGEGLFRSLNQDAGINIKGKNIIILGAGGAGRSAAVYLAVKGAKRIIVANRSKKKALFAVKLIKKYAPRVTAISVPLDENIIKSYSFTSDLIINATSLGLNKSDKPAIGKKAFKRGIIFYDMIYNPALTSTMKVAKRAGARVYGGIGMLLHQGALSWEIWTGKKAPIRIMKKALIRGLKKKKK